MMNGIIDDNFLYFHMKAAENHMLSAIPGEAELDHPFSKRFLRKMRHLLKYERRTPAMRTFIRCVKTAAAIFLIFISITFTTVMSVEAYRVQFFEFVPRVWEEFTSFFIRSEDITEHNTIQPMIPSYIPDGYKIYEQTDNQYENTIIYCDNTGTEIFYSQTLTTQSEFIYDSEGADINSIQIDNQMVHILLNKNTVQLYWHNRVNAFALIGNIDETELIKMAESIIKNN